MSMLASQSISGPSHKQWDAKVFSKNTLAGHRQQNQHGMKANQRFIWLGNLHLIIAVMS